MNTHEHARHVAHQHDGHILVSSSISVYSLVLIRNFLVALSTEHSTYILQKTRGGGGSAHNPIRKNGDHRGTLQSSLE